MELTDKHPNKNRLKVVLAEQNKSGKWLASQLGKNRKYNFSLGTKYQSTNS